jgi:hypothetical protein
LTGERLTPVVRAFLRRCIGSIEQLDTLLLLEHEPERWWSAEDVAAELQTSQGAAGERLEALASKNLLDVRISDDLFYRYAPVSPALQAAVSETLRAYKGNPVAVSAGLYSLPLDEIRDFAEAFRIRKRRDNDDG